MKKDGIKKEVMTLEKLAEMVQNSSFEVMQRELAAIKMKLDHVVYREEFEEVKARIEALEKKLARMKK